MPNVEVLSLSVNKIEHLEDFAHCPKLRELYLRKNNINDIAEIEWLKELPMLKVLWLSVGLIQKVLTACCCLNTSCSVCSFVSMFLGKSLCDFSWLSSIRFISITNTNKTWWCWSYSWWTKSSATTSVLCSTLLTQLFASSTAFFFSFTTILHRLWFCTNFKSFHFTTTTISNLFFGWNIWCTTEWWRSRRWRRW